MSQTARSLDRSRSRNSRKGDGLRAIVPEFVRSRSSRSAFAVRHEQIENTHRGTDGTDNDRTPEVIASHHGKQSGNVLRALELL
jgi:hypothetical protein